MFLECEEYPEDFWWNKENIFIRMNHMATRLYTLISQEVQNICLPNYICKDIDTLRIRNPLRFIALRYAQYKLGVFVNFMYKLENINSGQNLNSDEWLINLNDFSELDLLLRMVPRFVWSFLDIMGCFD